MTAPGDGYEQELQAARRSSPWITAAIIFTLMAMVAVALVGEFGMLPVAIAALCGVAAIVCVLMAYRISNPPRDGTSF